MNNEKCVQCGKQMAKYWNQNMSTKYVCNNEKCVKCGFKENNLKPKIIKIK